MRFRCPEMGHMAVKVELEFRVQLISFEAVTQKVEKGRDLNMWPTEGSLNCCIHPPSSIELPLRVAAVDDMSDW